MIATVKKICKYCLLKISLKDVLRLGTFFPPDVFYMYVSRRFVPLDILSLWTLGLLDIWSCQMFCPSRRFVPPNILSPGLYASSCYVTGHFVPGHFVPPGFMSPDVLSGHPSNYVFILLCYLTLLRDGNKCIFICLYAFYFKRGLIFRAWLG